VINYGREIGSSEMVCISERCLLLVSWYHVLLCWYVAVMTGADKPIVLQLFFIIAGYSINMVLHVSYSFFILGILLT
jgi:hypothetical protein